MNAYPTIDHDLDHNPDTLQYSRSGLVLRSCSETFFPYAPVYIYLSSYKPHRHGNLGRTIPTSSLHCSFTSLLLSCTYHLRPAIPVWPRRLHSRPLQLSDTAARVSNMHVAQAGVLFCLWLGAAVSAPFDVSDAIQLSDRDVDTGPATTDLDVYHHRDATAETTDVDLVERDRAAWVGVGVAATSAIAITTCSGSFVIPIIGPAACGLSLAVLLFTAVGSFLHGLVGSGQKRDFVSLPRAALSGHADDITWYHSRGDIKVHAPTVHANYVEGGPPLLIGESSCDGPECARLWYSHSTNGSWEGGSGTIHRITHTPKHTELGSDGKLFRRQDDTESGSTQGITGAYVFNNGDATTEYSAQTDPDFADDIVNQMARQNGGDENGKFSQGGVYCMNIDSDTRPSPLGTTGYLWYYQDERYGDPPALRPQLLNLMQ